MPSIDRTADVAIEMGTQSNTCILSFILNTCTCYHSRKVNACFLQNNERDPVESVCGDRAQSTIYGCHMVAKVACCRLLLGELLL